MQTKNLDEFKAALPEAWYLPSHSLVYADVDGNFAYFGVALTPIRKNWDGLLPVPGKDGKYEWDGFVPFDTAAVQHERPARVSTTARTTTSCRRSCPATRSPLGYEYSAPYRYERAFEVLSAEEDLRRSPTCSGCSRTPRRCRRARWCRCCARCGRSHAPVRRPPPPRQGWRGGHVAAAQAAAMAGPSADAVRAIDQLLTWNHVLDKTSTAATIYEYWFLRLQPLAYAPRVPEAQRVAFRAFDPRRVVQWMTTPDAAYGASGAIARRRATASCSTPSSRRWPICARPTATTGPTSRGGRSTPRASPIRWPTPRRRGICSTSRPCPRAATPTRSCASSSATETGADQTSGASYAFVFDVKDWDNSTGLNAPGQSAQPLSPHYGDLAPLWGQGRYVPMAFSRAKVDAIASVHADAAAAHRAPASRGHAGTGLPAFEPLQPATFAAHGGQANAWGDYDGDGDLDLFVGFRGRLDRLYRNDNGTFTDVALAVGLGDTSETRAAAWGDYDNDGDLDLYVGYPVNQTRPTSSIATTAPRGS